MIRPFAKAFFLVFILLILPVLPRWPLLLTWPLALTIVAALILQLSQPAVTNDDLKNKDPNDQRSVLLIYIGGALVFMIPTLDYVYGRMAHADWQHQISLLGIGLVVGGLWFRLYAIRTLGKWFTSVVRVQEGQVVISHGPYKYIRHPSYLGSFIMAIGISICLRSYVGLTVCFLIFFPVYTYRIRVEEETLRKELGEPYENFRKKTWKLLPYIY